MEAAHKWGWARRQSREVNLGLDSRCHAAAIERTLGTRTSMAAMRTAIVGALLLGNMLLTSAFVLPAGLMQLRTPIGRLAELLAHSPQPGAGTATTVPCLSLGQRHSQRRAATLTV